MNYIIQDLWCGALFQLFFVFDTSPPPTNSRARGFESHVKKLPLILSSISFSTLRVNILGWPGKWKQPQKKSYAFFFPPISSLKKSYSRKNYRFCYFAVLIKGHKKEKRYRLENRMNIFLTMYLGLKGEENTYFGNKMHILFFCYQFTKD